MSKNWVKVISDISDLSQISNYVEKYNCVIVKNCKQQNLVDEYEKLAKKFGKYLDYNNKAIYTFDSTSTQPVEYHTDGVSQIDFNKVPNYLFFHIVEWPYKDGKFKICNTNILYKSLDNNTQKILQTEKLQFYNYYKEQHDSEEVLFSFEIDPIIQINNKVYLRMFLPINDEYLYLCPWKYKMKFTNISFKESKIILENIRNSANKNFCSIKIYLEKDDILVLQNKCVFHGREKFIGSNNRILNRIQII